MSTERYFLAMYVRREFRI